MKKLFITLGRERDLIRYSEKSDLKDAMEISEEDSVSLFKKNFYSEEKARKFIQSVKDNLSTIGVSGDKRILHFIFQVCIPIIIYEV